MYNSTLPFTVYMLNMIRDIHVVFEDLYIPLSKWAICVARAKCYRKNPLKEPINRW